MPAGSATCLRTSPLTFTIMNGVDRHDYAHWAAYNARQPGRLPRELLLRALQLAGPAAGRTAVDLGCGAGIETKALLDAGWRVYAIDGEPSTESRLLRTIGGRHDRLTVRVTPFGELTGPLPPADLVYAGYSLPYQARDAFEELWQRIRSAVNPGGLLAVNIFGDRDEWATDERMTFLTEAEVRSLTDGWEILHWQEEDESGQAFGAPKHWHVFDITVRRPGRAGCRSA
jgi:SAM-dependent methyltransferase